MTRKRTRKPYDAAVAYAKRHRLGRSCPCGKPITDRSTTGQCKSCFAIEWNQCPEHLAKVSETLRRKYREDPEYRAKVKNTLADNKRRSLKDPANLAKQIEVAQINLAKSHSPEAHARRVASLERSHYAWCPPGMADTYRSLKRQGIHAVEAKAMVLEMAAAEKRRALARMSPFERQDAYLLAKMASGEEVALASNDMFRRRAA